MSQANDTRRRNPGPSWGYRFLRTADLVTPEFIYKPARAIGTLIAMAFMPAQRRHSREYLALALGRRPTLRDVFRHFFAFEESLMTKLRVLNGRPHKTVYAPGAHDAREWFENGGPVFLGTFHVGNSDLQGFQIGGDGHARVHRKTYIVRERVGNSHDTEKFAEKYGDRLGFIWVNDPREMIYALKDAASTDAAIALQCDRVEHSARTAAFDFLGSRRHFPITIYILAAIFKRPVILTFGAPESPVLATLHASPRFDPIPGETRAATLARGHRHFQEFLRHLEKILREKPCIWFNFLPWKTSAQSAEVNSKG
ncbi:MAG: hypothetical protein LBM04_06830 [Opitutaceae bacterium]|jgi:predicted LPLAT superfamily acyltransferase|nr:hypothetical protein [Opitutaceae bacterium]